MKGDNVPTSGNRGVIEVVGIWVAVCTGLTSLGLIVWKGGAFQQSMVEVKATVAQHTSELNVLKAGGTGGLRMHEAQQAEHEKMVEKRIDKLENAIDIIPQLDKRLESIQNDLDWLTGRKKGLEREPSKPLGFGR